MLKSAAAIKKIDLLLEGAAQIVTCQGNAPDALGVIEQGWIAISGERIAAVGQGRTDLEAFKAQEVFDFTQTGIINVSGKVVAPGFVDCHTHLVFGGSRVDEYVARLPRGDLASLSRRHILTGLEASMRMTREASENHLFEAAKVRLEHMLAAGTTTTEVKSGYGFTTAHELKQLRVIRQLGDTQPIELHPTFLGAHGWPSEMKKSDYIGLLIEEMIPAVGRSGLATACDVWCDEGYYTATESEKILSAALSAGMKSKIHTDAYSLIGGSELAADMKMLSADHLNHTSFEIMEKLAAAGVPGVLLPGTDFNVSHPRPFDPGLMLKAGMTLALATNLNPGNYVESMAFVLILACRRHGMTPEEAIRAATRGGAAALGLEADRGSIESGKRADLQVWNTDRYENMIYRQGTNLVERVIKNGKQVIGPSSMVWRREFR
jgi:imidazolonepropionase